VVENVPFVSDRIHVLLTSAYVPAPDYKALALSNLGSFAFVVGKPSEEAAKAGATEQCQKLADALQAPRKCDLYAVGNIVVYALGKPPVPWIRHDPVIEKPFVAKDIPLLDDPGKALLERNYAPGKTIKTIAIGPGGQFFYNVDVDSVEESARRNLKLCGAAATVPCMIVAADDVFVVPVPAKFRVIGFFRAVGNTAIAVDAGEDLARKLAEPLSSGWSAVAVGAAGRPGLGLKAATEQDAINEALGNCVKSDNDCRIIAIGPFSVRPN
jgi:adenylate cyclase